MAAQLDALQALLPRVAGLPTVASASINKSTVPVIALTAEVPAAPGKASGEAAPAATREKCPADAAAATGARKAADEGAQPADATAAGAAGEGACKPSAGEAPTMRLHVDISINTPQHRGLIAAEHVRWLHQQLPPLAPLVTVLKALLHRHNLKATYTGGLSSYALVTMVSRFLLDRHGMQYSRPEPPSTPVIEPAAVTMAVPLVGVPLPAPPSDSSQAAPPAKDAPAPSASSQAGATIPSPAEGGESKPAEEGAPAAAGPTTVAAAAPAPPSVVTMAVPVVPVGAGAFVPIGAVPGGGPMMAQQLPSLGSMLVELLSFYGHVFNPKEHAILGSYGMMLGAPPPGCGFVARAHLGPLMRWAAPQQWGGPHTQAHQASTLFSMDPLVSIDPVDLRNNTAKSCYRVGQLQKLFADAAKAALEAAEAEALAVRRGEEPRPLRVLEAILDAGSERGDTTTNTSP
jgi:hypothetical protein